MTTPVDVFVDFSRIGYATRFTSRVRSSVRALLHEGDAVTVSGDDVGPLPARVVRMTPGDPVVEFELLADWVAPTAAPVDVSVDFSRVGCAMRFTIPVQDSVRTLLHEGGVVTVSDDDVPPRPARVVRLVPGDPAVGFELLVPWSRPATRPGGAPPHPGDTRGGWTPAPRPPRSRACPARRTPTASTSRRLRSPN